MSEPPISQPPGSVVVASRIPPAPGGASKTPEGVARLRDELGVTKERPRQARILYEIGELEERSADEPGAARDYLAAFNADPAFREPLEGLVRLLERRRSVRNLGKLIDALVRAASTPSEKARGLLMRAAYLEDVSNDLEGAKREALQATTLDDTGPEGALAWLTLEMIAAKTGERAARAEALHERATRAGDSTWRALLLMDLGRLAASSGDIDRALSILDEARGLDSAAAFAAARAAARLIRGDPGPVGSEAAKERLRAYASTLEAQADLIRIARSDAARGDSLGVPLWTREATHLVDSWLRAAEAHRLAGEVTLAAGVLDRALKELGSGAADSAGIVETAVVNERIRTAELMGDTALAAELSQKRIANEQDGGVAAALAMRAAEHAASNGDASRALEALSLAVAKDPACIPARALQLDLLADGGDSAQFASQLESFADHFESEEARGRAFLLAAFVWGMQASDVAGAKAALSQAGMYGIPPSTIARIARAIASVATDAAWHEESTRRLIASGPSAEELPALWFEVIRSKLARRDVEGVAKALRELGANPNGAWLAHAIEAFVPGAATDERQRIALDALAAEPSEGGRALGASIAAAMRAQRAGDLDAAKARLRALLAKDPSSTLVTVYLAELERAARAPLLAASTLAACAAATDDRQLAPALYLEAGFERWRAGEKTAALEAFEEATKASPVNAQNAVGWASRAMATDAVDGRRKALERGLEAGDDAMVASLERLAIELGGGDPDEATNALATLETSDGPLRVAAALARLAWSQGAGNWQALQGAADGIASLGEQARLVGAAERLRLARDGDPETAVDAARAWFNAGGGLPAALEWIAASLSRPLDECDARLKAAELFEGEPREQLLASATLLGWAAKPDATEMHFVDGTSPAARLANLELARPGVDPRRRAKALVELDNTLGEDVQVDALALAGWSLLVSGDTENALKAFGQATRARADDLCSWEGLRATAEAADDKPTRAEAAEELGARCFEPTRGAAFWEEAALLWLDLGEGERAEIALDRSFARDPSRPIAFDKLFRRVRERKESDRLLDIIERRLLVSEDPTEMVKLYWERSRVLREKGDSEGALVALENVTMVEPDHVGALALQGEIFIRRGDYTQAAECLGRLSGVDSAPPRNRVTAGIAAVDLYENKLDRFDKALEVLLGLHRAKLSSLAVRERLARAAARTGSWEEAANILEELMLERPEPEGRIEAAQLAMAIRRDRLHDVQGAKAAVSKLLEESPAHGEAIDALLALDLEPDVKERLSTIAKKGLVGALEDRPADGVNARRLAFVAKALHDTALEQVALSVAETLGQGTQESRLAMVQLVQRKPRTPQIALTDTNLRKVAAPGDEGPIAALFTLLGPTLAEALGPSLGALGVGKRDRIDPRAGLALRNEVASWAGAFGIREFELYVGGKDPMAIQGVPAETPALVVGPGVNAPLTPPLRARIARELYAIARGTTVLRSRDETTVAAIVVAACKLGEVRVESPPYAVLAEVEKVMSKAIARRTRKLLGEACAQVVASRVDARAWSKRALASQDRAELLASGDVAFVCSDVLGVGADRLPGAVTADGRPIELLRFALSPLYLELRRALGLEGTS